MKRILFLLAFLLSAKAFGADVPLACSGANCKVIIETRDGSNVKVSNVQFSSTGFTAPGALIVNRETASGSLVGLQANGYGSAGNGYAVIQGRSARGTLASPTATQANDILLQVGGRGYGTTAFGTGDRASIKFVAGSSPWTDSDQAGGIQFFVNPSGTSETKSGEALPSGAWTVGPTSYTGPHTINGRLALSQNAVNAAGAERIHVESTGDFYAFGMFSDTGSVRGGLSLLNVISGGAGTQRVDIYGSTAAAFGSPIALGNINVSTGAWTIGTQLGADVHTLNGGLTILSDTSVANGATLSSAAANIANAGVSSITSGSTSNFNGLLMVTAAEGFSCMFMLRGSVEATTEIFDPANGCSSSSGTASSVNIYFLAPNYRIQNNRTSQIVSMTFFNQGTGTIRN